MANPDDNPALPELLRSLPFEGGMIGTQHGAIRKANPALEQWLRDYSRHANAELEKLTTRLRTAQRAEGVLRSLRMTIGNAASALAEIDARPDAYVQVDEARGETDAEWLARIRERPCSCDRPNPVRLDPRGTYPADAWLRCVTCRGMVAPWL